jgi:hypothetical protein
LHTVISSSTQPSIIVAFQIHCLQFIQAIVEKSDWHKKINDGSIVEKWKTESIADLRDNIFKYAMKELRHILTLHNSETGIELSGARGVEKLSAQHRVYRVGAQKPTEKSFCTTPKTAILLSFAILLYGS